MKDVETKIIALIHGEISGNEAVELLGLIESDESIKAQYEALLQINQLAGEATKPETDTWKMEQGRRQDLLEVLSGEASNSEEKVATLLKPKQQSHKIEWRAVSGIAACVAGTVLVAGMMFEDKLKPLAKNERFTTQTEEYELEEKLVLNSKELKKSDMPILAEAFESKRGGGFYSREGLSIGKEKVPKTRENNLSRNESPGAVGTSTVPIPMPSSSPVDAEFDFGNVASDTDDFVANKLQIGKKEKSRLRPKSKSALLKKDNRRDNSLAKDAFEELSEELVDVSEGGKNAARQSQRKFSQAYEIKNLNDEVSVKVESSSTFSLHVSDVSFKLAKSAMLDRGAMPDRQKIRPEEFVNAFDYGDPSVRAGNKVACHMEQVVHPFMQQRHLMRVSMSTAALGRSTPLRLTVLLDNSGSMERVDREASVLKAMEVLVSQLQPQDEVSLISFSQTPRIIAEGLKGGQLQKLVQLVKQAPSEGGTNMEKALKLAGEVAKRNQKKGAQSRIVLMTDGAANLGNADPEDLNKMIVALRQQGVAFDACGVGADKLDDTVLEALARKGDGRYYLLDKPEDADGGFAKQLAGALRPAASNVKVQVVFNPSRVMNYKLLGFEKHLLKQEDFRNDKVDAAEMAGQEAGSAMYQFQPLAGGKGDVGKVFVRFRDMNTGQMVERSWTIPYVSQPKTIENAKPSIQLATTAAMLAEKIRKTDAGLVDFSEYGKVLGDLNQAYGNDQRVKDLIQMVEQVRR